MLAPWQAALMAVLILVGGFLIFWLLVELVGGVFAAGFAFAVGVARGLRAWVLGEVAPPRPISAEPWQVEPDEASEAPEGSDASGSPAAETEPAPPLEAAVEAPPRPVRARRVRRRDEVERIAPR